MAEITTDSRSSTGIAVGLVDAIMVNCQLLRREIDGHAEELDCSAVAESLKDLRQDSDVRFVCARGPVKITPENLESDEVTNEFRKTAWKFISQALPTLTLIADESPDVPIDGGPRAAYAREAVQLVVGELNLPEEDQPAGLKARLDEVTAHRDQIRCELDHLQRKIDHGCADAFCTQCDGIEDRDLKE